MYLLPLDFGAVLAFPAALILWKLSPIHVQNPIVKPLLADTRVEFEQIQVYIACQVYLFYFFVIRNPLCLRKVEH